MSSSETITTLWSISIINIDASLRKPPLVVVGCPSVAQLQTCFVTQATPRVGMDQLSQLHRGELVLFVGGCGVLNGIYENFESIHSRMEENLGALSPGSQMMYIYYGTPAEIQAHTLHMPSIPRFPNVLKTKETTPSSSTQYVKVKVESEPASPQQACPLALCSPGRQAETHPNIPTSSSATHSDASNQQEAPTSPVSESKEQPKKPEPIAVSDIERLNNVVDEVHQALPHVLLGASTNNVWVPKYDQSQYPLPTLSTGRHIDDVFHQTVEALPHAAVRRAVNRYELVPVLPPPVFSSFEEERWAHMAGDNKPSSYTSAVPAAASSSSFEENRWGHYSNSKDQPKIPPWQNGVACFVTPADNESTVPSMNRYGFKLNDTLESAPATPLDPTASLVGAAAPPVNEPTLKLAYLDDLIASATNTPASSRLLNIIKEEDVHLDTPLGLKLLDLATSLSRGGELASTDNIKDFESMSSVQVERIDNRLNDFAGMLNAIADAVGVNLKETDDASDTSDNTSNTSHVCVVSETPSIDLALNSPHGGIRSENAEDREHQSGTNETLAEILHAAKRLDDIARLTPRPRRLSVGGLSTTSSQPQTIRALDNEQPSTHLFGAGSTHIPQSWLNENTVGTHFGRPLPSPAHHLPLSPYEHHARPSIHASLPPLAMGHMAVYPYAGSDPTLAYSTYDRPLTQFPYSYTGHEQAYPPHHAWRAAPREIYPLAASLEQAFSSALQERNRNRGYPQMWGGPPYMP